VASLNAYVTSVKSDMSTAASEIAASETSQYLQVADNWSTPTVSYGHTVTIVLPIINLGKEELRDIVIEPQVTGEVTKWPFEPDQTGYIQTEPFIPGYLTDDQSFANRREFTYTFKVREDVMTGFYPLKFKVSFTRAGVRIADDKATELTVYVQTIGKPESGYIGGNGLEDKKPKSRIIVTGYKTDVEKINSGDAFNLTISIQNTSSETAVTNILINLSSEWDSGVAASGSTANYTRIEPFMPTSGSNSVYIERIAPKATADINISMTSRPALAQMSYPLQLSMTYDSGTQFDLTDKASISIPVYQESKFDMSSVEVSPSSINVGSQANVMFSIYNTGKTTLYNTQVVFEADSVESNMAFVGNLASGATGNVDIMLTGIAATMDGGDVKMIISYEDESGNVTQVEKTCQLYVNEEFTDDDMGMNSGMREPVEEETKDNSALIRALVIILIIVLIIAAVVAAYIYKKNKKEKALHEEDLKDLEEIKDLEDTSDSE